MKSMQLDDRVEHLKITDGQNDKPSAETTVKAAGKVAETAMIGDSITAL